LIVHAENSGRHTEKKSLDFLEQNGMKNVPHSLCRPDLAPSDFYLFGHVKQLFATLTQFQPEDGRTKPVGHPDNVRAHTAQNVELFAKKMDCGSLPIHPTHLISHHPTSFCSVMSRNVPKE
jgi:hypothetical protein